MSSKKQHSIAANYPLVFEGDPVGRYLNHMEPGGAIWNIFYLHCLSPQRWPIFDQHTFRAMHYLKSGDILEIGSTNKQKYAVYQFEYIPFLNEFSEPDQRKLDRALFSFGQFLKMAKRYASARLKSLHFGLNSGAEPANLHSDTPQTHIGLKYH